MPPKVKFTKEMIASVAFDMVRKHGAELLSARGLAAELGSSTAPIFTAFDSIEEVRDQVIFKARKLYKDYLEKASLAERPFKEMGMQYIRFAADEPELFKLLFMGGDEEKEATHYLPDGDENSEMILNTVESLYGMSKEKAMKLYNHLSVYTHGLAVLFAQRCRVFTMEDVNVMLTEIFNALTKEDKDE